MKFKNALLIFALISTTCKVFAQTSPDAIIAAYFKAIGGKDKVAAITTMNIDGNMEVMGNSAPNKITIINGKAYKSEMNFNGQSIIQSITDTGAWMINPFMGSSTAIPAEQYGAMKDEIFIGGSLFNYKPNDANVQYAGIENMDGKSAKKIVFTKDSVTTTYYIDSATNYVDEKIVSAGNQSTTVKYSNYKQTDAGVLMAYNEELTVPQGMTINYTISKIEFNKPVDASVFAMPKQ